MNDKETPRYPLKPDAPKTPLSDVTTDVSRSNAAHSTQPLVSSVKIKQKKSLLVTLIVVAVAIISLGLFYLFWYQNPEKVVSDAITNVINAKSVNYTGKITATGSTEVNVAIDGGVAPAGGIANAKFTFDVRDKKYTLSGNGLINKNGDLYFKAKDIEGLVGNYRSSVPATSQPLFDSIIAKVNDKWIKVSADDLKGYSEEVATAQKCITDAVKKIQSDDTVKTELMAIYKKHPFIVIDKNLAPKDGHTGYKLTMNHDASKAFTKDYKKTSFYVSLQKCDNTLTVKGDDLLLRDGSKSASVADVSIWVDQWSHQITNIVVQEKSKSGSTTADVATQFNRPVIVPTPKDATTLEQLQKDVEALLISAQSR